MRVITCFSSSTPLSPPPHSHHHLPPCLCRWLLLPEHLLFSVCLLDSFTFQAHYPLREEGPWLAPSFRSRGWGRAVRKEGTETATARVTPTPTPPRAPSLSWVWREDDAWPAWYHTVPCLSV